MAVVTEPASQRPRAPVKRWGSRRRPAKRHGRVESLDSDPHPNLRSTGPFSGCTSCKGAARCWVTQGKNRGEAGLQTVHRLAVQAVRFWHTPTVSESLGLRQTESAAVWALSLRLGGPSPAGLLVGAILAYEHAPYNMAGLPDY